VVEYDRVPLCMIHLISAGMEHDLSGRVLCPADKGPFKVGSLVPGPGPNKIYPPLRT
jgi:hypothetical protein